MKLLCWLGIHRWKYHDGFFYQDNDFQNYGGHIDTKRREVALIHPQGERTKRRPGNALDSNSVGSGERGVGDLPRCASKNKIRRK